MHVSHEFPDLPPYPGHNCPQTKCNYFFLCLWMYPALVIKAHITFSHVSTHHWSLQEQEALKGKACASVFAGSALPQVGVPATKGT